MAYKVIAVNDFAKYRVRGVADNIKLILAWTAVQGDETYCVNIIRSSTTLHDIIPFVRESQEKNNNLKKKFVEDLKYHAI